MMIFRQPHTFFFKLLHNDLCVCVCGTKQALYRQIRVKLGLYMSPQEGEKKETNKMQINTGLISGLEAQCSNGVL